MPFQFNRKLLPLKGMLFSYFCGFGCLWPFFGVHQKQLGLSIQETAIINLVLPFLSAICAPILGTVVDRFGHYRRFLVFACIFMAILYSTLMFVPPVTVETPFIRDVEVYFLYSNNKSVLAVSKHGRHCALSQPVDGQMQTELRIWNTNCSVLCTKPRQLPISNRSELCFRRTVESSSCVDPFAESENITVKASVFVHDGQQPLMSNVLFSTSHYCFYYVNYVAFESTTYHEVFQPDLFSDCFRACPVVEIEGNVVHSKSEKEYRHSMLTFWLYIITRAMADVLFIISYPLTDAISISLLREHGGSFGRQMLCGIIALGIAGPIVGKLNDVYTSITGRQDYMPCFIGFDVFMLVTVMFVYNMPFRMNPQPKGVYRAIMRLLKDVEVLALYIAVITLGTNYGFLETFLYWFLQDLGASWFLIGITWTVGVFPSLPFLYKSKMILERVGHANLLAFAFIVYAIRYLGYSFIDDPWLCLPFESIEVFTFFLTRATFCTYSALLSPPSLMVTSQAMMASLHLMIGRGCGSLIGGYLMAAFGPRRVFRGAAAFCCVCGITYFLLYQLHIKARQAKKKGGHPNVMTSDGREGSSLVSAERDERAIPMEDMMAIRCRLELSSNDHSTVPFLHDTEIMQEEMKLKSTNNSSAVKPKVTIMEELGETDVNNEDHKEEPEKNESKMEPNSHQDVEKGLDESKDEGENENEKPVLKND